MNIKAGTERKLVKTSRNNIEPVGFKSREAFIETAEILSSVNIEHSFVPLKPEFEPIEFKNQKTNSSLIIFAEPKSKSKLLMPDYKKDEPGNSKSKLQKFLDGFYVNLCGCFSFTICIGRELV